MLYRCAPEAVRTAAEGEKLAFEQTDANLKSTFRWLQLQKRQANFYDLTTEVGPDTE